MLRGFNSEKKLHYNQLAFCWEIVLHTALQTTTLWRLITLHSPAGDAESACTAAAAARKNAAAYKMLLQSSVLTNHQLQSFQSEDRLQDVLGETALLTETRLIYSKLIDSTATPAQVNKEKLRCDFILRFRRHLPALCTVAAAGSRTSEPCRAVPCWTKTHVPNCRVNVYLCAFFIVPKLLIECAYESWLERQRYGTGRLTEMGAVNFTTSQSSMITFVLQIEKHLT